MDEYAVFIWLVQRGSFDDVECTCKQWEEFEQIEVTKNEKKWINTLLCEYSKKEIIFIYVIDFRTNQFDQ